MSAIADIIKRASKLNGTVVLPEGMDPRVITAACACVDRHICTPIVLGTAEEIAAAEEKAGLHFMLDIPDGSPLPDLFAQCGVRLSPLEEYYDEGSEIPPDIAGRFVVNYSAADEGKLAEINEQPEH